MFCSKRRDVLALARQRQGKRPITASSAALGINPISSARRSGGLLFAALLVFAGCTDSSNPVGGEAASPEVEHEALGFLAGSISRIDKSNSSERPSSSAAKTGGDVVLYTFDDLPDECGFNQIFPATYQDLTFSDSRLISVCIVSGDKLLTPGSQSAFDAGEQLRNLITLPRPATEVSIWYQGFHRSGDRSFAAYDAAGSEIDRASSTSSSSGWMTVTGDIHQVAIIELQNQTYWDDLTVTYCTDDNEAPVADAGVDQQLIVTETATLDGSASSDADGDVLSYAWTWVAVPGGSGAAFSDPSSAVTTFTADLPGIYTAQLIVNDGTVDSDPDEVTIEVLSIADAISDLRQEITALKSDGFLNKGQANSLQKKVDFVRKKLGKKPHVAVNKLNAFANQVAGFVRSGVLSDEQGGALIAFARRLIAAIESEAGLA